MRTLGAHKRLFGWPHTLLAKVKQQQRALALFLKSGWAALSGNRGRKGGPVRRASRAVVCASRSRGDPDGLEAFGGHRRPTRSGRERCPAKLQLAGILHPSAAFWHRSALAICGSSQNCSSTSDCGGPSLQVIEPLSQSDRACNPLHHRTLLSVRPLWHRQHVGHGQNSAGV